jgi:hypothetical protein
MKSAIEALPADNETAVLIELATWETGEKLPSGIYDTVCEPILSLTTYLIKLTENINKLTLSGDNTTLSGDNTKAITEAQTSTDNLTKTVGCVP